jgi:hypothetical protein
MFYKPISEQYYHINTFIMIFVTPKVATKIKLLSELSDTV